MDTSAVITLVGRFLKFVGETLAEAKRQDLAAVDADLLRLKRDQLSAKLEEFRADLDAAVKQEKARAEQDLITRGLGNTTVRDSMLQGIERDAATELERATREYNRAIEEIALLERKLEVQRRPPWWKKVLHRWRLSRP